MKKIWTATAAARECTQHRGYVVMAFESTVPAAVLTPGVCSDIWAGARLVGGHLVIIGESSSSEWEEQAKFLGFDAWKFSEGRRDWHFVRARWKGSRSKTIPIAGNAAAVNCTASIREATMHAERQITTAEVEEMFSVLFRIVRTSTQAAPIGHDVMVAARSIVRRLAPDAYRDLTRRREKTGLPPQDAGEIDG